MLARPEVERSPVNTLTGLVSRLRLLARPDGGTYLPSRQGAGELPQAHTAEQAAEVLAREDRVAGEKPQHGLAARLQLVQEIEALEELDERAVGVVAGVRAELDPEAVRRRPGVEATAGARVCLDDVGGAAGAPPRMTTSLVGTARWYTARVRALSARW